ncbi:DUF92 domain-containing protein [Bacillus sp. MRMR6]|uniref:DUF92 domain-containing protein n=1 Tax=Bacillus sp. MRMR6 TaxID=1928617 RepID=UPI000951F62D|nr:DUF92 domain-containing protein [Bacillus sp. MRMR6]OLS41689.1 hypothetical protein BTR25_03850 [Bacillus sp. MRMR6]
MIETYIVITIIVLTCFGGYMLHSLSNSGAIAAAIVGLAVYFGFGLEGLFLLGVFFATSSLWSKYKNDAKAEVEEKLAKGARRDWRQVFANGGAAALISIVYIYNQDIMWLIGFSVCLASANSDTWASEIGSLSKRKPIFIRTFRSVDKGTSGAISLLGTVAALLGSLLIAMLSTWIFQFDWILFFIIFAFGFIGNVIDTLIGAFYQQVYICEQCGIETEKTLHCQFPTRRIKGLPLVDNDMVNFLSGLLSAVAAILVIELIK